MTETEDNSQQRGAQQQGQKITPIDFTPFEPKPRRFPLRLRRWHGPAAGLLLLAAPTLFFVLTARSVYVEVEPVTAAVDIDGGFYIPMGRRYLIRRGEYSITLSGQGYHGQTATLQVSGEAAQTFTYRLRPLPGLLSVTVFGLNDADLTGAVVSIDGEEIGRTPLEDAPVEPGSRRLQVSLPRYQDHSREVVIEGREVEQSFSVNLLPAWATVGFSSAPTGAELRVDGEAAGVTPIKAELLQGRRDVSLHLPGHKPWRDNLSITAGEDFDLPLINLEAADGLLSIRSEPPGASVTVDGEFHGLSPLQVAVTPDEMHEISFFSNGYHGLSRRVQLATGEEREVAVQLQPVLSGVQIIAEPADAQLYVDGEHRGPANQTIRLRAASQRIEVRRPGYVPYRADFTPRPGLEQVLRVRLQTEAEARRAALKPLITTAAGQELKLFDPGRFMMGSSRREAGRRPDEILLGEVRMARPFYLGLREVSNAQYRRFDPSHNSGIAGGATLNNEAQPAVQLSWEQAALYCNWLSGQESLRAFYIVEDGTVVGIDPAAGGYRLPTEAEWAWAARSVDAATSLRYPWGEAPPPPPSVSGNFADATVIRFIPAAMAAYDDGHFNTAPVASFPPNHRGLYDMAGNAAEWINDYYGGSVSRNREPDPLGPQQGLYRVIRGPSWKHSGTDLRLSARDSALSTETRDDLGFRIARYTEE